MGGGVGGGGVLVVVGRIQVSWREGGREGEGGRE